jgi:hypothetical protein
MDFGNNNDHEVSILAESSVGLDENSIDIISIEDLENIN